MGIEGWILISNIVIIALVLVGGFYLRHLVNRQVALKDAAIQAHEATIRRLEGISAPAVVKEVATLSQFAEDSVRKIAALSKTLEEEGADTKRKLEGAFFQGISLGAGEGAAAMVQLARSVRAETAGKKDSREFVEQLANKAAEVLDLSVRALAGQRPSLVNFASTVRPELRSSLLEGYWQEIFSRPPAETCRPAGADPCS